MAERVRVREIGDDEGRRLLRIVRRGAGSVVTWRQAQMVLLSTEGLPVAKVAEVTFTSGDRVRDAVHSCNADGFESLHPKYGGGRPKMFTLPERREIKKIAKSRPVEHGLPGQHDPPLHQLAKQAHRRRAPAQRRRPGQRRMIR
ncbi:hypothetical protein [Micromonospora sp. NPDC047074]|uniref:hypothetical protein n=1 Tax=Micromonospora sp. NPDC047074 TaxID=3154339 RepID=UPI0033F2FB65